MPYKNKEDKEEYDKKYYIEHRKEKLKASKEYREIPENKEKKKEYRRKVYARDKKDILNRNREYKKRTSYMNRTTKAELSLSKVRVRTQRNFPIGDNKCGCGRIAEHRHHTTTPMVWDKFKFMCKKCHNKIHGRMNYE